MYFRISLVDREVARSGKQPVPPRFSFIELVTEFSFPRKEVSDQQGRHNKIDTRMYAIVICFHNVLFYVLKGEMYIKKFTKRKKRATFAAVNGIMIYEL